MGDRKMEEEIVQFVAVTGASTRDARKFLEVYKRIDVAIDNYFNDPQALSKLNKSRKVETAPSTSKLGSLFDKYKDDSGEVGLDGTLKMLEDLEVDPEDVGMLPIVYELKSPRIVEWRRQSWVDGWKALGVDSLPAMKSCVTRLRNQLASDPKYFRKVYLYTFEFAKNEGQRSLGLETAQAYWGLLLPHGLKGGALAHVDENDDVKMGGEGFKPEYVQWWFDFLDQKGGKGVSKDTWNMLVDFIRTIDSQFKNYDAEGAWPSAFDEFVEYAQNRLSSQRS